MAQIPSSHPLSLEGWIPAEGSYKMKGLWARESRALASLGDDPREVQREVSAQRWEEGSEEGSHGRTEMRCHPPSVLPTWS